METVVEETEFRPEGLTRRRSLREYAGLVARGFCMGSADVVPGVSGGTMAFILGIYEELLESIRMAGQPLFWRALVAFQVRDALQIVNISFLASVMAGIVLAVVTLAPGIEWLLINQPVLIWSFFFGLVLASVFTVRKRVKVWSASRWIALALGTAGAFLVVGMVPAQTPETRLFLMLTGALAICAMILPGISGSFILVLLGKYEFFVSAVNQRNIVPLFWAGLGAAIGLVTFAQILSWLFKRYHDVTVAVLTGFMLGSLRKVWPWKEAVEFATDRHGELVPIVENNVLPSLQANGNFNMEISFAFLLALMGLGAVLLLDRWANRDDTATKPAPGD